MAGDPSTLGERDIRLVLAALADPVVACDGGGTILYINAAAERLLGASPGEFFGESLDTIVPERLRRIEGQEFRRYLIETSRAARGGGVRAPVTRRDGVEINVEFSAAKTKVSSGELEVFCLRHLTEPEELPTHEGLLGESAPASATAGVTQYETLRLIFENAPLGIFHFDTRGVITACNDNFVDIIGSSRRVLVGLDIGTLPDRGIADSVRRALDGHGAHYEGDYRSVTAGKVTPVRVDFAPIRSENGQVLGGVGIVEDITERRKAELAVRRSEAAFRTLIEAAPDGIAVYRDGRLVFVNPAFVSELGYDSAEQLIGREARGLIHPDYHEQFDEHTRVMLASWQPIPPREKRLVRRDGSEIWVEIATLPIDFDGEPAVLLLSRDLTERKQMAARLAQADRMASVGTLAAGVAHEINNPLAYVLGSMDLCSRHVQGLAQHVTGPEARALLDALSDCLQNAHDGADRVRVIVRDLMTFSRAESDQPVAVDVEKTLDSSVNLVWNEIRHRARLVKSYSGVPAVLAEEARLGQVFVNLLVNAAQAIPEGRSEDSEIRVTTSSDEQHVYIDVADDGAGIPAEELGHIFEPFYTTKPMGVGTGLGLSICHGIVSALGGTIKAYSTPGKGSRFRVELPTAPAPTPSQIAKENVESGAGGKRILVIDDEPLLGQTLRLAFSGRHEVVVAISGREALSRLREDHTFDLVLCDLMMPDIGGMAVYEEVLKTAPEIARRFAFMTGGAFTEHAREFLENYEGPHLEKPFDISQVEALLAGQR